MCLLAFCSVPLMCLTVQMTGIAGCGDPLWSVCVTVHLTLLVHCLLPGQEGTHFLVVMLDMHTHA